MYRSIDQLPSEIRDELPQRACELYRAAYNRIMEKESPETDDAEGLEITAHQAGMLAVRAEFTRGADGKWRRDPVGDEMPPPNPEEED